MLVLYSTTNRLLSMSHNSQNSRVLFIHLEGEVAIYHERDYSV